MTLKSFVFFDANSTATESNTLGSLERAEEMMLQVSGTGTINLTIQAKTDLVNGSWSDISSISMKSLSVCQSISQTGIYNVPLNGIAAVRIVNNGSTGINVYGKIMG